jgi:hypothetical protein
MRPAGAVPWRSAGVRVYVQYKVHVLVEVDLDDEEVVAVLVDDEQLEGPADVIAVDADVSALASARALAIAENESWPAWEFGL